MVKGVLHHSKKTLKVPDDFVQVCFRRKLHRDPAFVWVIIRGIVGDRNFTEHGYQKFREISSELRVAKSIPLAINSMIRIVETQSDRAS